MATKKKKKKQNIKTLKSYAVVITQHIMSGFQQKIIRHAKKQEETQPEETDKNKK